MKRRVFGRSGAVAAGVLADWALGEPPAKLHPVAAYGAMMEALEAGLWRDSRLAGVAYSAVGVAVGAAAGNALGALGEQASVAVATWSSVAARALHGFANRVADALEDDDLESARGLLPALVGRDPSCLDSESIAAAVVESVAENTVDALVAPVIWALLGGAPGALCYRAVNTMDSMVGSRSKRYRRFGWSSARVDDLANWLPARLTVLMVMASRPTSAGEVMREVARARRERRAEHSPNALIVEAAFAGALGVSLGGKTVYHDRVEERPKLGSGPLPRPSDIRRAVALSSAVRRWVIVVAAVAGAGLSLRKGNDDQRPVMRLRMSSRRFRRSR